MPAAQEQITTEAAIVVNGEAVRSPAKTLAALLDELGYGDAKIATAVNGSFVSAGQRSDVRLQNGDQIEVVAPRQGG